MQTIKKVGVLSFAKIQMVISAIMGFFIGLIGAIAGVLTVMGGLPAWILVLMPFIYLIIYGIIGFVFGAIGAAIYNWVAKAKWIGGLQIELK